MTKGKKKRVRRAIGAGQMDVGCVLATAYSTCPDWQDLSQPAWEFPSSVTSSDRGIRVLVEGRCPLYVAPPLMIFIKRGFWSSTGQALVVHKTNLPGAFELCCSPLVLVDT